MTSIIWFIAGLIIALFAPSRLPASFKTRSGAQVAFEGWPRRLASLGLRIVGLVVAGAAALSTSIIRIPPDKVGIVQRVYGFSNLSPGHIIAANGENGYQASIIPPGTFRVSPFFNIINRIIEAPVVVVPNGFYGRIITTDGDPLDSGDVMADEWPDAEFQKFLDAEYFMKNRGRKGLQLSVLKPGTYPLNLALYNVRIGYQKNGRDVTVSTDDVYTIGGRTRQQSPLVTAITRVPAGYVGVVRSTVQTRGIDCTPKVTKTTDTGGLTAEVVPVGCKGVWARSLPPNDYYLNRDAYDVTLVSTRVTTLEFKGGYTRRYIDLKVDAKGDFRQTERHAVVPVPKSAVAAAVTTKMEGWEIPQELRAIVQITPENAPVVVAAVGGQAEVDQRIVVPAIRSHVRNVYGSDIAVDEPDAKGAARRVVRPTRVLDTIDHRTELEQAILDRVHVDGLRAGVNIKEIRLGESAVPPELLLARQREQLAGQLKAAYIQEQRSQEQRQLTEQARATADQQSELVKAQIGVQTAKLAQDRRQAEGHAERLYMEEQAAGQSAQTNVLGKENVMRLQQMQLILNVLKDNPTILGSLRLPSVYVAGGAGLDSASAIIGSFLGGVAQQQPATAQEKK